MRTCRTADLLVARTGEDACDSEACFRVAAVLRTGVVETLENVPKQHGIDDLAGLPLAAMAAVTGLPS